MNPDTVYQTISLQFFHSWHSGVSERSHFTRNLRFLLSIASLTGNTV